jgi:hypothetical protein
MWRREPSSGAETYSDRYNRYNSFRTAALLTWLWLSREVMYGPYPTATLADDRLPDAGWYASDRSSLHRLTSTRSKKPDPPGILANSVSTKITAPARERVENDTPHSAHSGRRVDRKRHCLLCSEADSVITGEIIRVSRDRM